MKFVSKILAFLACYVVPNYLTLGVSRSASIHRLARWYETNGFYKFSKGDVIRLKDRRIFGYGVNPTGIVMGQESDGKYLINMTRYENTNYSQWADKGKLSVDATSTISQGEKHFKWNIENQFCRVS